MKTRLINLFKVMLHNQHGQAACPRCTHQMGRALEMMETGRAFTIVLTPCEGKSYHLKAKEIC